MIRFADKHTSPLVRAMWKECFGDTEEFMEMYFSRKYHDEDTLVYLLDGSPVASLQMHPYRMTFYGEEVALYYLSGICTLPRHRGKGYASSLIMEVHRELHRRGVPLALLIPASAELYDYYARFGYEKVFESDDLPIPLGDILDSSDDTGVLGPSADIGILDSATDMAEAYDRFDAMYRDTDFCVQKSPDDFAAIVADYLIDGRPVKTNLDGAACLLEPMRLLEIYAAHNPAHSFTLHLKASDNTQETFYQIEDGNVVAIGGTINDITSVAAIGGSIANATVMAADRRLLTKLLFGYKTGDLPKPYRSLFPEHHPVMNLMLE